MGTFLSSPVIRQLLSLSTIGESIPDTGLPRCTPATTRKPGRAELYFLAFGNLEEYVPRAKHHFISLKNRRLRKELTDSAAISPPGKAARDASRGRGEM